MIQLWKPENLKKEETKMLNSDSIISPGSITLTGLQILRTDGGLLASRKRLSATFFFLKTFSSGLSIFTGVSCSAISKRNFFSVKENFISSNI